jgi:hypothetical protein
MGAVQPRLKLPVPLLLDPVEPEEPEELVVPLDCVEPEEPDITEEELPVLTTPPLPPPPQAAIPSVRAITNEAREITLCVEFRMSSLVQGRCQVYK